MFVRVEKNCTNCKDPIEETKNLLKNNVNIIICTKLESNSQVIEMEKLINDLGLEYEIKEIDNHYQLTTVKGIVQREVRTNNHYLLYLDRDYIGVDKNLGALLLNEYLEELLNSSFIPNQLLLINEGVLILNPNLAIYKTLEALEKIGVNIFICVKSLNYYHIDPKGIIGNTLAMDEIIKLQLKAEKVIKL